MADNRNVSTGAVYVANRGTGDRNVSAGAVYAAILQAGDRNVSAGAVYAAILQAGDRNVSAGAVYVAIVPAPEMENEESGNDDIILGSGQLWYAPVATANPDETGVGYGEAWGGAWASLGHTLTPLVLNFNEERVAVETQQSMGTLTTRRIGLYPTLRTVLAESSLQVLLLLLRDADDSVAAGVGQKAAFFPKLGADVAVQTLKFGFETLRVDGAGVKQTLRFFFHLGSIMADGESVFDREVETGWPVVIDVYEDGSQAAGGEFLTVQIVRGGVVG